jgi:hypothetical protein
MWPASTATVPQLTGNGTLFPRQTKHDGSEALILPLAGHGLAMIEPSCRRFHPSLGAISKSRDRDDDTMDEDETSWVCCFPGDLFALKMLQKIGKALFLFQTKGKSFA